MYGGEDGKKVEGTISQGVLFLLPYQLWSILEGGRVNAMVNGINNITWVVFNVIDYLLCGVFSGMKTMLLLTRREIKSSRTLPGLSTARYEG